MKRGLALAFVVGISLSPACKMREQVPQNVNLNKAPAPIVETIRDAGVKMADNKEKLIVVPKKAEETAAEKADAGAVPAPQHKRGNENKKLELPPCPPIEFPNGGYLMPEGPPKRQFKKVPEIH